MYRCLVVGIFYLALLTDGAAASTTTMAPANPAAAVALRRGILSVSERLLEEAQISYVYGGYQVGDSDSCRQCNSCLAAKAPRPAKRLTACPVCRSCSLDCSHFTELVFREAGAPYPYIATPAMLGLTSETLRRNYSLIDLGLDVDRADTGDLLVYNGHVVILERLHPVVQGQARYRGDIVHATGGRDIKRPGEGVQRERFVDITTFRGPLLRVLRHRALAVGTERSAAGRPRPGYGAGNGGSSLRDSGDGMDGGSSYGNDDGAVADGTQQARSAPFATVSSGRRHAVVRIAPTAPAAPTAAPAPVPAAPVDPFDRHPDLQPGRGPRANLP